MQEDLLDLMFDTQLLAHVVVKARVGTIGARRTDHMGDLRDIYSCFSDGLTSRGDRKSNAVLQEEAAEFCYRRSFLLIRQRVVHRADCRTAVDASIVVYRAYLRHSADGCQ